MYQVNPLLESNVKSFEKFVTKIRRSPNSEENLVKLGDKLSSKIKQRSLPGFETRTERKLKIVKDALAKKAEIRENQRKAAKVAHRFVKGL